MKTKIFCDIADLPTIRKFNRKKIVKGFTTNPSLMRKAGAKNYEAYSKQILKICKKKPISFEVFSDDYFGMEKQALKITKWGKNVFVKIPVIIIRNHHDQETQSFDIHVNRSHSNYLRDLLLDGCTQFIN